jgi:hypothetical protein
LVAHPIALLSTTIPKQIEMIAAGALKEWIKNRTNGLKKNG